MSAFEEMFLLFCENAEITILSSEPVQYGTQYRIERHGEEAYMTLYENGNSLPQGPKSSYLLRLLHAWSNKRPGSRNLSEDEQRTLSGLGMPAFYLSWREWKEDANLLTSYIQEHGEPDEAQAPEDYKIHREIMFHDYMFKEATNLSISLEVVQHIIKSWLCRFCNMNIDAEMVSADVVSRIRQNWNDDITTDDYVSFYYVVEELTYIFTRFCQDKWVVCGNIATCPQKGNHDTCLTELIDSMYVYCKNQHVLSYTKTNMRYLLNRDYNKLSWISLAPTSPIEAKLGEALYQSGILSIPQYQALAPERRFKVDFLIKAPHGGALAVECDGLEYHANPGAYVSDRRRDNLLTSHGFQVLRFSSVDIQNDLQGCINQIEYSLGNFQQGRIVYHRNDGLGYFGSNL